MTDITAGVPKSADVVYMAATLIMACGHKDTAVCDIEDMMNQTFEANGFELVRKRPETDHVD